MGESTAFATAESGFATLRGMLAAAPALVFGAYSKLSHDELIEFGQELETLRHELWAAQVHLVDEIDQQGLATARSCASTQSLLRQSFNLSPGDASLLVQAARATQPQDLPSGGEVAPRLPLLGAAIDRGEVAADHVRTVIDTLHRLPDRLGADVTDRAEQTLVSYAVEIDPGQFRRIARHLEVVLNPDGVLNEREAAAKVAFTIGARSSATGLTSINGYLDDLGVATLRAAIDGLAAPKPDLDGVKDIRPAAMRRAHALVELCAHALSTDALPEQAGERPHITVTLNWDLIRDRIAEATLDSGQPLSPAATRELLCDAKVIPAVLGGAGEVLDLGRSARTFNRATRRAITLRDQGCAWPGCDRPPAWTQCHHVAWWVRDFGDTSYHNGCLLCSFHHAEIHKGEWVIVFAIDGVPEFIPPKWIDKTQRPRRYAAPSHPGNRGMNAGVRANPRNCAGLHSFSYRLSTFEDSS